MKLITQYLTEQMIESFKIITKKTGIKRAELIRQAIQEFLTKNEQK